MIAPDDPMLEALRQLTRNSKAEFRDDQREAIELLLEGRRVIVVQRTGWGKSAVYFVATKLLREKGSGPTLLISPLLGLMRNQIEAATDLGLRTYTINSSAPGTVTELVNLLNADEVDLLVVSPERLANPEFANKAMPIIGSKPGLTVIDEVHCISDWGHDFRPDYRRIGQMLSTFPPGVPIVGCTATANERVLSDVREQLGGGVTVLRGPLPRKGLALHVISMPEPADRLTWLARYVGTLPGSGIVYCLTKRDAELVSSWLMQQGVSVDSYHGSVDSALREDLEARLSTGDLKVIVATSALGMGYDNPRIGFVVHYQSPGSVVHYYQQVGRAGRVLDNSVGVLLRGTEDSAIIEWFIDSAFPSEEDSAAILGLFTDTDRPISIRQIQAEVNLKFGQIESALKQLDVGGFVRRIGWQLYEATLKTYAYPHEKIEALNTIRRAESLQMDEYAESTDCRMGFLVAALDDNSVATCGICDNCAGRAFQDELDPKMIVKAQRFIDLQYGTIEPRKVNGGGSKIPAGELLGTGKYLCRWGDSGYGKLVRRGKQIDGRFDEVLLRAFVDMIQSWGPQPAPTLVTCVPSWNSPTLVSDFAQLVAQALAIPFKPVVERVRSTDPQKTMQNSAHQARNVEFAFRIDPTMIVHLKSQSVLLIDDIVDSKWTFTAIGRLLRAAGCDAVFPAALASSQSLK